MTEFKVGLLAIVAVILLIVGIWTIGGPFRDSKTIYIEFSNIGALNRGAEVKLQGVTVGNVAEMTASAERRMVVLTCRIFEDTLNQISTMSTATIESSGIVGETYVQLGFRPSDTPPMQPGETIRGTTPRGLDDVTDRLAETLDSVQAILGTEETRDSIQAILMNTRQITEEFQIVLAQVSAATDAFQILRNAADEIHLAAQELHLAVADTGSMLVTIRPAIEGTVSDVSATASWLRETGTVKVEDALDHVRNLAANLERSSGRIDGLIHDNQDRIERTLTSLETGMTHFSEVMQETGVAVKRVDSILQKVESGQGPVGRLLTDEEWERKVDDTLSGFESIGKGIQVLSRPEFYYELRGYESENPFHGKGDKIRHDLGMRFALSAWDEVTLGVNHLGEDNEFELTYGRWLNDWLMLYGGVIESDAGLGISVSPHRDLRLYAEGIGLTRKKPERLDIFGEWRLSRWFRLLLGAEDVTDNVYFMGGIGLDIQP